MVGNFSGVQEEILAASWRFQIASSCDAHQLTAGPLRVFHVLQNMRAVNKIEFLVVEAHVFHTTLKDRLAGHVLEWNAGSTVGVVRNSEVSQMSSQWQRVVTATNVEHLVTWNDAKIEKTCLVECVTVFARHLPIGVEGFRQDLDGLLLEGAGKMFVNVQRFMELMLARRSRAPESPASKVAKAWIVLSRLPDSVASIPIQPQSQLAEMTLLVSGQETLQQAIGKELHAPVRYPIRDNSRPPRDVTLAARHRDQARGLVAAAEVA